MAFAADFVGGLAGGLGQGVNMYAQLQQMAQAQKQQEYQQQLMEQRNQAQEAKTQQDKLNTLLNIAKLKPDVREYALQTVGPSLGLDPNDPQIKALLAGAGMDENFVTNLRGAGRQFGLTPEQTGVLEAADPNVAAQQLFGFNRAQQSNELGQERLGLSEQRLGLATQGQELSAQRLREQMDRFDQRMAGNIPPIGFKPGFDQLGGLTSLTAVPGGPQTIPTGRSARQPTSLPGHRVAWSAPMRSCRLTPTILPPHRLRSTPRSRATRRRSSAVRGQLWVRSSAGQPGRPLGTPTRA